MAHFNDDQWRAVFSTLAVDPEKFGMPERRDDSVILASWNIRKFGKQSGHSEKAREFYAAFATRCDLLAVQEVMADLFSVRDLCDRMNASTPSVDYGVICSDVTGKAPGSRGNAERLAFIYNKKRLIRTEIASDLSFDRSEILRNVNTSLMDLKAAAIQESSNLSMVEQAKALFEKVGDFVGIDSRGTKDFYDFIRSPHLVSFNIPGKDNTSYDIACVNAHLLYGKAKQREIEFLALLEWVFLRSDHDAPIAMILGDLNLDFHSNNDARRSAIKAFLQKTNANRSKKVNVNFPFLSDHPQLGEVRTNAREKETFDHIAYFHSDDRLPREEHNSMAGHSPDTFDYGMFHFVDLFRAAGVISQKTTREEFALFEHDVSDHMPVWVRVPLADEGQHRFT